MAGARVRYFHGGAPGLAVGDVVVPRCELPADVFDRRASSVEDPADATRTYITENVKVARGFALRYANSPTPNAREGWLYEVLPDPNAAVEPDPDFPTAAKCWTAPRCTVLAVVEQAVPGGPRAVVRAIGPYIEWADGRRAYTRDGYMTPSPQMREYGVNIDQLRRLGQWVPIENVLVNRHTGKISVR